MLSKNFTVSTNILCLGIGYPGDQGSIPGRVILKTWKEKKKVLDATLFNN